MKDHGIQRSVRAQRFVRSAGDAPNIGRVARVPGTGLPKGERRSRKRGERGKQASDVHRRNVIVAWSVLIFTVSLAVLGFFLWTWLRGQMGRTAKGETDGQLHHSHKASQFASPREEQAMDLVKQALSTRDPLQALAYFRPGRVEPLEIVNFLARMEQTDGPIQGYQWLSSMDANGLLIEGVLVSTELDGKPRNRLALLTPDDLGVWKIDFEAFARTVRPPWEKILADDGGKGVARVIVAKDTYFNGPFRDDTQWSCYGMASPDIEQILLGYCRKDSPQDKAMKLMFPENPVEGEPESQRKIVRATVQLERPPTAENRQFEIKRVLAEDWIVSDVAFDRVDE